MNLAVRWRGVAVTFLLLCAPGAALAPPLFSPSQDPVSGSRVFGAKGCGKCHSVNYFDPAGNVEAGGQLIAALWNHSFIMEHRAERRKVSWPKLRPEEMADLVAFLEAQGRSR